MSVIKIKRAHELDHAGAKDAADQVASSLAEEFNVKYRWEGDTVKFKGAGAKGYMRVTDTEYDLEMQIGFLLLPFKGRIEQEIHKYMDKHANT